MCVFFNFNYLYYSMTMTIKNIKPILFKFKRSDEFHLNE